MGRGNRGSFLMAIAFGLAAAPALSKENTILVDADQFTCLAEQISVVPAEPDGVYVNIRNCRKVGPRIMRFLVPPTRQPDANGVESLLFLQAPQVRCIRANRKTLGRIATPAGPGRLKVRLDACGR